MISRVWIKIYITLHYIAKMSANFIQFLLSGSAFGNFSIRSQLILFQHVCLLFILDFFILLYSTLFYTAKTYFSMYLQYEVYCAEGHQSIVFFEATTSRSWAFVNEFHNVYFGKPPGFNLQKLTRLSGVFPPFVGPFFDFYTSRDSNLPSVLLNSI